MVKKIIALILLTTLVMSFVPVSAAPSFGTVTKEMKTMGTVSIVHAVATIQNGEPIAVLQVGGSGESIVQVVSINDEKVIKSFNVPADGKNHYGMADSKNRAHLVDGNQIYVYDPKDQKLYTSTNIPTAPSGSSTGVIEFNGKFYGSTTSFGRIFSYTVGGACTTVCDLTETAKLNGLGGLAGIGDSIYTGGSYRPNDNGGTNLYKINPSTGAATKIANPQNKVVKSFSKITDIGKYVFAEISFADGETDGYLYDTVSKQWIDKNLSVAPNCISQEINGKKYFLENNTKRMHSIDVNTLETVDLGYKGGNYFRGSGLPFKCDFFGDEVCYLQSQFAGVLYVYTTTLGKTKQLDVDLLAADEPHRISRVGHDGDVYVTAFMGTRAADYDPDTKTSTDFGVGQAEGIVSRGTKMYFGTYPGAEIFELDTTKPYASGTNPRLIYDIPGNQDRPFGMDIMDNKLLVGTLPKSGTYHGAFTVIDLDDFSAQVYTTDKLGVSNHSVMTITHDDRYAYLGTSVCSGGGTEPATGGAFVIKFDMQTRQVSKKYELKSFAGYTNVKGVHGLRISPYDGLLYGACEGIDFKMNPSDLSVLKTNVHNKDAVKTVAKETTQLWHEHYMQFYNGYLFRTNQIIDPDTLKVVATAGTTTQFAGTNTFAGINNNVAYFVDSSCTVYSVPLTCSDTMNTGLDLKWDDFEPNEGSFRVEGGTPVYAVAGKTLSSSDTAMKILAGNGEGKNPTQTLDKTAPGMVFQPNKTLANGTQFVVGMDVYLPNENVEALLMAPVGSDDGEYQVPLYLEKGGKLYFDSKRGLDYYAETTLEVGKWNKIEIKYSVSGGNGSSAYLYVNGVHTKLWEPEQKKYVEYTHSYNTHLQKFKEFDIRVAARTTDEAYAESKTYDGRDEYLIVDNVYLTSDTSKVGNLTLITDVDVVDFKTLNVTFNKAYSGNLVGTEILDASGATATTVASESVSGNVATLTLSGNLSASQVYSIQPSGVSESYTFKLPIVWKGYDNENNDFANGSTIALASKTDADGSFKTWAMYGNGDGTSHGISHEKAGYQGSEGQNYEENGTGMATHFAFPSTIADDTYAVKFNFKRDFDSVSRLETRHSGQRAMDHDALSIMIDKNGNVTVQGNKIGNVGANEWHTFVLKTTVSSEEGKTLYVYLDGTEHGPYTNTAEFTKQPVSSFSIYATAYTSDLVRSLGKIRSDARAESLYIKNLVVTNDMDVAFPETLSFYNVKNVSRTEVLFSASKNIDVPAAANVTLDGVAASATEKVASNSFKATFAEVAVNKTHTYSVTIDGTASSGSFLAKHPEIYETFDDGTEGFAWGMYQKGGTERAFWSHEKTSRDGKEGYTDDKAFGFSSEGNSVAGLGYNKIDRNNSNAINWFHYATAQSAYLSEERLVFSADFMRGNNKVGFIPFAFMFHSRQYQKGNNLIEVTPAGEFKVAGTKYRDFGVKEWHNVTVHVMISSLGNKMNVYFDGELVASNLEISNFYTIMTIGENDPQTDAELSKLGNTSTQRNEIIIVDNMYVGRDIDYKTSNIVATASENDVTLYTGAIKGGNPMISALYTSEGKLKDIKIGNLPEGRFQKTTVTDALDMEAGDGEVVKFFVVNNLLNLRPISNVIVK